MYTITDKELFTVDKQVFTQVALRLSYCSQHNTVTGISPDDIARTLKISTSECDTALSRLTELGYLTSSPDEYEDYFTGNKADYISYSITPKGKEAKCYRELMGDVEKYGL